ncbi:hypothetical protein AX769_10520 [Frondihabitans sp. PAMC 28766]|uniref:hypothetical protein n=1 Tax=Frondihabitans sp. PAMC 28766 TaxID=1795630 RepID=UPI00078B4CC8|nr:hypothetical protein [Frondihabitans sp. PAMC 28766]AMM20502.1 hypothetical protein AX769_10520 [Frondihabitans sp. PAMC 28766]
MTVKGATKPRRITKRADIAEGWRLFRPFADEVLTSRRRRALLGSASAVGVVVSAASHLLYARTDVANEAGAILLALATGVFAAQIVSWVLLRLWRPPVGEVERVKGAGSMPGDFSDDEIRRAWAEGREPQTPIAKRLAAADRARIYRAIAPRTIVGTLAGATWFVPFVLAAIALLPHLGVFAGAFGAITTVVTPFTLLAALGRTTAAIETAPDVPDHLEADGRRKSQPRRILGTDHPDDYT